MSTETNTQRLSFWRASGYGTGDIASSLAVTTNALFLLKFATDALGLDGTWAGIALLMGKLIDAVTDPLMGEWVDRTRHKWGSKRPFLFYGALPFGLSFFLLYSLPKVGDPTLQFVLFAFCCALQSVCFTICNIPYTTLTASLTQDSQERTRLTTFRFFFSTIATIIVATATPSLSRSPLSYTWVGAIYGTLMTLSLLVTFATTAEQPPQEAPMPWSLKQSIRDYISTWKLRTFRILVGIFFLHTIAFALLGAWVVFFAKQTLLMESEEIVVAPMIATALITLVPWYLLSTWLGKKQSFLWGTVWSIFALLLMLWPAPKATVPIVVSAIILGVGFSSYTLFPYAMIPDVIEEDEWETGHRREGLFYGVWVFIEKLGRGFAFLLAGMGLSLIGYKQGVKATPEMGTSLRWLLAVGPTLFLLPSIYLILRYPLTTEAHKALCDKLEARKASSQSTTP